MILKYTLPYCLAIGAWLPSAYAVDEEGRNTDLRLELSLLEKSYDWDATADSGLGSISLSDDDEFDDAFRVGLAGVSHLRGVENSPVGLVGGGALNYTRLEIDDGNAEELYQALSVQVRLGIGLYLGDIFHVEATPLAGIGAARGDLFGSEGDIGLYWEYGFIAGAFVSVGGTFQLGLIGGWLHGEYDLDFDDNEHFSGAVDNVNVDLIHEGLFIGLSLGTRT